MYLRAVHAELDIPTLHKFIQSNPFGLMISTHPSADSPAPDIEVTHIPWVLDIPESSDGLGKLRGHMARANPHAKALLAASQSNAEVPLTIVFNGPVDHYVSAKLYTETKPATHKVVPTWNYSAVQVTGRLTLHDSASAFLQSQVEDLSDMCEAQYTEGEPWAVSDAPEKYVGLLKKAIVGLEVEITKLVGKAKMNQEVSEGDRAGIVEGFETMGTEATKMMAHCIREKAPCAKPSVAMS